MHDPEQILDELLSGRLSGRAQGCLMLLPQGYRLHGPVDAALTRAYGTLAHPDIRIVRPGGKGGMIGVEEVRDARPFLASTPSAGGMKTLVLLEADRLNRSAANALLKSLEEPTPRTRILLTTDAPAMLPATIRSRCAVMSVRASAAAAAAEMRDSLGETPSGEAVADALVLADGNPALAAQMLAHDLVAWSREVEAWLDGADPTPPLPRLAGKSSAPLGAAAQALQALLVRRCRRAVDAGHSTGRASAAAWAVAAGLDDIARAGIDARTRLHVLLGRARDAAT